MVRCPGAHNIFWNHAQEKHRILSSIRCRMEQIHSSHPWWWRRGGRWWRNGETSTTPGYGIYILIKGSDDIITAGFANLFAQKQTNQRKCFGSTIQSNTMRCSEIETINTSALGTKWSFTSTNSDRISGSNAVSVCFDLNLLWNQSLTLIPATSWPSQPLEPTRNNFLTWMYISHRAQSFTLVLRLMPRKCSPWWKWDPQWEDPMTLENEARAVHGVGIGTGEINCFSAGFSWQGGMSKIVEFWRNAVNTLFRCSSTLCTTSPWFETFWNIWGQGGLPSRGGSTPKAQWGDTVTRRHSASRHFVSQSRRSATAASRARRRPRTQ